MKSSIGIIGGADGPTAVFISSSFSWEILLIAAAIVVIVLVLIKRKK